MRSWRAGPAWMARSRGSGVSSGSRRCLHRVEKLKNWEGGTLLVEVQPLHISPSWTHPPPQFPGRPIFQLPFWSVPAPAAGSWQRAAGEARPRCMWPPSPNPGKEQVRTSPRSLGALLSYPPSVEGRLVGRAEAEGCETSRTHSPQGWLVGQRTSDTKLREGQHHG